MEGRPALGSTEIGSAVLRQVAQVLVHSTRSGRAETQHIGPHGSEGHESGADLEPTTCAPSSPWSLGLAAQPSDRMRSSRAGAAIAALACKRS